MWHVILSLPAGRQVARVCQFPAYRQAGATRAFFIIYNLSRFQDFFKLNYVYYQEASIIFSGNFSFIFLKLLHDVTCKTAALRWDM